MTFRRQVAARFLAAGIGFAVAATPAAGAPGIPPAPTGEVERAVVAFSAALGAGDAPALTDLAGPGFALLEQGRVYDLPAMLDAIRTALSGGTMRRVPSGFQTTTRGNVAWSRYRVTGEYKGKDGIVPISLHEAAVLERTGGRWRVALLTSMPASQAP